MNPFPSPPRIALVAITFLFGWQSLRSLLSLMSFLLRDRLGWGLAELTGLCFGLYLTSFLAPVLRRLLGARRLLVGSAAGVAVTRLGLQVWTGEPLGELALALAATVFFLLFLATRLLDARAGGPSGTSAYAVGCWLGLTLDSALHGLYRTYDMSWQDDVAGGFLLLFLAVVQFRAAWGDGRHEDAAAADTAGRLGSPSWTWLGFGPFLFLEAVVLQNIARLTALTGWSQPAAFAWVLAGHVLGLGVVLAVLSGRPRARPPAVFVAGLVIVATQAVAWPHGTPAALLLLLAQLVSALWLAVVLVCLGARRTGRCRLGRVHGVSMIGLLFSVFLYYTGYTVALPFDNTVLLPLAALVLAVTGFGAARSMAGASTEGFVVAGGKRLLLLVALLFLLPIYGAWSAKSPEVSEPSGFPVRFMTYNVHLGFDPWGHLGPEAVARAIETQDPDVVALQEVPRGWMISGSLDLLEWLSQRLGMSYVSGPTADPLWGNAVLSRLPIVDSETHELPSEGLRIKRGFLAVRVDVGDARPLQVIATHFHHRRAGDRHRVLQARAILEYWQGRERTVFAGDLNAEPGDEAMELLRRAGMKDAYEMAGEPPGYTYSSRRPVRRIDYVRISPDLLASDAVVAPQPASDHMGVAATIDVAVGEKPVR